MRGSFALVICPKFPLAGELTGLLKLGRFIRLKTFDRRPTDFRPVTGSCSNAALQVPGRTLGNTKFCLRSQPVVKEMSVSATLAVTVTFTTGAPEESVTVPWISVPAVGARTKQHVAGTKTARRGPLEKHMSQLLQKPLDRSLLEFQIL